MSTRAHVTIRKGDRMSHIYHHCDGYPSGVGSELSSFLSDYKGEWEPDALRQYFNERDGNYEPVDNDVVWDQEYVYVIDCEAKTLRCYYKGITDGFDYDNPCQGEIIPDNRFAICNCMTAAKRQELDTAYGSRRERIAIAAMQGIWSNERQVQAIIEKMMDEKQVEIGEAMRKRIAEIAVAQADALINELDNKEAAPC